MTDILRDVVIVPLAVAFLLQQLYKIGGLIIADLQLPLE